MAFDINEKHLSYVELLNREYFCGFDNFKMGQLLYTELYQAMQTSAINNILSGIRLLFKHKVNVQIDQIGKKYALLMLTYSYSRKDHDNEWEKYKHQFSDYTDIKISSNWKLHFDSILRLDKKLFGYLKRLPKDMPADIKFRMAATIKTAEIICNRLKQIRWEQYKCLITYFDGGLFENTVVQYAKKCNLKTVTLQHSQPIYFGKTMDRLNQTTILNLTSNYSICKGTYSKKQFLCAGVEENRVPILGGLFVYPSTIYREWARRTCVFLDAPTFAHSGETNSELINYVSKASKKLEFKYWIKPHPMDQRDYSIYAHDENCLGIVDKAMTLDKLAENIQIAFLHTSGIYVDLLNCSVKPFRLSTQYYYPITEKEEEFTSEIELIECIKRWNSCNVDEKIKFIDDKRKSFDIGYHKEKQISFIQSLMKKG